MKKIYIRKIFPYDPTFGGKYSKYEGYSRILKNIEEPSVIKPKKIKVAKGLNGPIFCSSSKRGIESARLYSQVLKLPYKVIYGLGEIKFSLEDLLSEKVYRVRGSNLVREMFINRFVNDTLPEKRKSIKQRLDKFLTRISHLKNGRYLAISHSFIMKLMETYLKEGELFNNPEILRKYFNFRLKTFEFGSGFEFES